MRESLLACHYFSALLYFTSFQPAKSSVCVYIHLQSMTLYTKAKEEEEQLSTTSSSSFCGKVTTWNRVFLNSERGRSSVGKSTLLASLSVSCTRLRQQKNRIVRVVWFQFTCTFLDFFPSQQLNTEIRECGGLAFNSMNIHSSSRPNVTGMSHMCAWSTYQVCKFMMYALLVSLLPVDIFAILANNTFLKICINFLLMHNTRQVGACQVASDGLVSE